MLEVFTGGFILALPVIIMLFWALAVLKRM